MKIESPACILLAALLVRLALLPMIPLVDPDEGRYGQIAQQMVLSGDWVTPRLWLEGEQVPFLGKPPMQFWLAAACMKVLGVNETAARIPSLVAAALLVLLMFIVLRRYVGQATAELAALLTASNATFFVLSGTVIVDMVLTFFTAGALLAYFAFLSEVDREARRRWSLLVFVLLAGGFMTKGPVAIMLFGLPTFLWTAWKRKWGVLRDHTWGIGILLFVALVAPWFWLCEQRNPGFLKYFFLNENLLRYIKHDYGDLYGSGRQLPRGSAALMMIIAALPWCLWAVRLLWSRRRERRMSLAPDDASAFFLTGFVANTIFWCFARQLMWTYMLPLIPLFSVWLALIVHRYRVSAEAAPRAALGAIALYGVLCAVVAPHVAGQRGKTIESVLARATAVAAENRVEGPFLFVRKTPYSAYFYARDRLLIHPKESAADSVRRGIDRDKPCLMLIQRRYLERVPTTLRTEIQTVDTYGPWLLCVPTRRSPASPKQLLHRVGAVAPEL